MVMLWQWRLATKILSLVSEQGTHPDISCRAQTTPRCVGLGVPPAFSLSSCTSLPPCLLTGPGLNEVTPLIPSVPLCLGLGPSPLGLPQSVAQPSESHQPRFTEKGLAGSEKRYPSPWLLRMEGIGGDGAQ